MTNLEQQVTTLYEIRTQLMQAEACMKRVYQLAQESNLDQEPPINDIGFSIYTFTEFAKEFAYWADQTVFTIDDSLGLNKKKK